MGVGKCDSATSQLVHMRCEYLSCVTFEKVGPVSHVVHRNEENVGSLFRRCKVRTNEGGQNQKSEESVFHFDTAEFRRETA